MGSNGIGWDLPSGKHTNNCGKSAVWVDKSTISMSLWKGSGPIGDGLRNSIYLVAPTTSPQVISSQSPPFFFVMSDGPCLINIQEDKRMCVCLQDIYHSLLSLNKHQSHIIQTLQEDCPKQIPRTGPSGKQTHIAMENHHAIDGKSHYEWPCSIVMLNYQRVPRGEITKKHKKCMSQTM